MKSTLGKDTFNENTSVNTALISGEIESSGSLTYRRPLGILIDSQTSGSSAFFASALAQLNRTVVIGDTSAGKFGTFHENKKITRPNGERIFLYHPGPYRKQYEFVNEGRGLIPDQKVLFPFNKNIAGDIQFDTAVLTLLSII
jgi:C-terminal processing protease CtpA/Prc